MLKLRRALAGLLGISTALAPLLAAGALGGAAPASGPVAASGYAAVHPLAHRLVHASGDSNWGGYAVTGGTYKAVTGNWVVPSLNCAVTKGDISFWSGLDGWTSTSVEQIGLDAVCASGGKIEYNPWVEMYPANSIYFTEIVMAGDTMTSSVTTDGSGTFTLVLADPTQGWTKTYTETLKTAALSSAEVIVEAIGGQRIPPCPDFGAVQFGDVTANGTSFASAGTVQTTNLERSGVLLTQDGSLTGTAFGVTWLHK